MSNPRSRADRDLPGVDRMTSIFEPQPIPRGALTPPQETTSAWDQTAKEWEGGRDQTWREYSDELNLGFLERHLPTQPIERALKTDSFDEAVSEVGLAARLQQIARELVVMDVSHRMVRSAAHRHRSSANRARWITSDVRHLPLADSSFDLIFSNSTLDHFESILEIGAALVELRRVLRPGGRLLLTLDNRQNPIIALRNALPERWLRQLQLVPYPVGANCSPRKLTRLLRIAGLEPRDVGSLVHCPRVAAVPVAAWLDGGRPDWQREAFLRAMRAFEGLEKLPSRYFTGHFITVVAERA